MLELLVLMSMCVAYFLLQQTPLQFCITQNIYSDTIYATTTGTNGTFAVHDSKSGTLKFAPVLLKNPETSEDSKL